ncbi:MAG: disulfide bond formation protein B [Hyphomicrobiales bacterium]|nr:disulfide bond formation protein B [Hyphomicrobiales bacterium]
MFLVDALLPRSQTRRAALILLAALAVLAAAWILQGLGYEPCELCLTERYAFYAAAPLAALTALFASRSMHGVAQAGFALIALVFLANAAFAFYHVGVEQHWWPGPTACTGALSAPVDVKDLLKALETTRVVSCDVVQLRILGLSLAGWDVVASAALAIYAALAARLRWSTAPA